MDALLLISKVVRETDPLLMAKEGNEADCIDVYNDYIFSAFIPMMIRNLMYCNLCSDGNLLSSPQHVQPDYITEACPMVAIGGMQYSTNTTATPIFLAGGGIYCIPSLYRKQIHVLLIVHHIQIHVLVYAMTIFNSKAELGGSFLSYSKNCEQIYILQKCAKT